MLDGKIVLITGGNTGIGAASAKLLSKNNATVIINYRTDKNTADELVSEINKSNKNKAIALKADVSDETQVKKMVDTILEKYGKIDILINNASPETFPKRFDETDWPEFQKFLQIIFKGAYNTTQAVLPAMLKKKQGNIINILTSYVIAMPPPKLTPYITAKYALEGFSKALASELGPFGIRVNMISPGLTKTKFTKHLPAKLLEIVASQTPLKRVAVPEDVAKVVLFLASDNSDYLTGVNIPVCGGNTTL